MTPVGKIFLSTPCDFYAIAAGRVAATVLRRRPDVLAIRPRYLVTALGRRSERHDE